MKKVLGAIAAGAAAVLLLCCGGLLIVAIVTPDVNRGAAPVTRKSEAELDQKRNDAAGERGGQPKGDIATTSSPAVVTSTAEGDHAEEPTETTAPNELSEVERTDLADGLEEAKKLYRRTHELRRRMDEAKRSLDPKSRDPRDGQAWGEFARGFRADFEVLSQQSSEWEDVPGVSRIGLAQAQVLSMFLTYTSRTFGTEGELRYKELGQLFDDYMRAAWSDIREAGNKLSWSAPAEEKEERATSLLRQAEALMDKGRDQAATERFQRILDEYPVTQAANEAERRLSILSISRRAR